VKGLWSIQTNTMAEEHARNRQYEYRANSNLVLTAERDKRRDASEPTGEVESLHGRISYRMGDKANQGTKAPELEEKIKKAAAKRERQLKEDRAGEVEKAKKQKVFKAGRGASILTETDDLDSINYRPKTKESAQAYEAIMSLVQQSIGDQPQDVLRGAAEEVFYYYFYYFYYIFVCSYLFAANMFLDIFSQIYPFLYNRSILFLTF
jgi:pre-mRNA-splicing helicase BRR2